jgi:hypothetical protein
MDGLAGFDYVFYPGAAMNANKVKIFRQGARPPARFLSSQPEPIQPQSLLTPSRSTASSKNFSSHRPTIAYLTAEDSLTPMSIETFIPLPLNIFSTSITLLDPSDLPPGISPSLARFSKPGNSPRRRKTPKVENGL